LTRLFSVVLLCFGVQWAAGQNYIDLLKVNYGTILGSQFEDTSIAKDIDLFEISATIPIPITKKTAVLTGIDYNTDTVTLFPQADEVNLRTAVFKLGLNLTHSDKWSGIYLLQPKISSRALITSGDSFFIGGLAIVNYKVSDRLTWRFGFLASDEAFGTLVSPIAGIYYQSKNKKWELDAYLPGRAQLDYGLAKKTSVGVAFVGQVRSFGLDTPSDGLDVYAEGSRTEVGPYVEQTFFKNMLRLRLQGGYSSVRYEVFEDGDVLPFRLSAIEFNDDRDRINPLDMQGAFYIRVGATFRLFLNQ